MFFQIDKKKFNFKYFSVIQLGSSTDCLNGSHSRKIPRKRQAEKNSLFHTGHYNLDDILSMWHWTFLTFDKIKSPKITTQYDWYCSFLAWFQCFFLHFTRLILPLLMTLSLPLSLPLFSSIYKLIPERSQTGPIFTIAFARWRL